MSDADTEVRLEAQLAREQLAREQRASDFRAVLELPQGRRVLEALVYEYGGLEAQPHSPDSHQRSFNDGQRQVAIVLKRDLRKASKDLWSRLVVEREDRLRLESDEVFESDQ